MNLDRTQFLALAKKGASQRLAEIDAERATLMALLRETPVPLATPPRRMSLKARKQISRRMRRYWRERKSLEGARS